MAFDPISILLDIGGKVIDRVFPDPVAKAQAQLELFKLQQSGELAALSADVQMTLGQLDVNKAEASNPNTFVSGWRPFVGWTCGAGFAVQLVVGPFATWGSRLLGHPVDFPPLDIATMMPVLIGMLGLGGMRTYEKYKGVA